MNRVLEAIAEERSELSARLQALEEMERIAVAAVGEQTFVAKLEVASPAEPETERAPTPQREPVRSLPPVLRSQQPPQPRRAQATPDEIRERVQRVYETVQQHEPVQFGEIVRRTDLTVGPVKRALEALRKAGKVEVTGEKAGARWHTTAALDRQTAEKHGGGQRPGQARCREDVLQTIRSEPNAWTEQRIANSGAWDREHVADACGYLLNDGLIVLNPDGTYQPALLGLKAAA